SLEAEPARDLGGVRERRLGGRLPSRPGERFAERELQGAAVALIPRTRLPEGVERELEQALRLLVREQRKRPVTRSPRVPVCALEVPASHGVERELGDVRAVAAAVHGLERIDGEAVRTDPTG